MKAIICLLMMLNSYSILAQTDSTRLHVIWGSANPEMNELYEVLKVDPYTFKLANDQLKNQKVLLTFTEYREGKIVQSSGDKGSHAEQALNFTLVDSVFSFKVYAHKTRQDTVELFFRFPRMGFTSYFRTDRRDDYSLRHAATVASKEFSNIPIGKKVPFLVYALPYEDPARPGMKFYCKLTNDGLEPEKWWDTYKVKHYVVFYLKVLQ